MLYGVVENIEIMQVDGVDNRTATLENCLLVPQKLRMPLLYGLVVTARSAPKRSERNSTDRLI